MQAKFTFLGTGSSLGIPVIGCHCTVCQSSYLKNQRMRVGVLLEIGNKKFVIDASPDFRRQALMHKIEKINGFILTHSHYDHIAGFDDIKIYKEERKIPCLMLEETFKELEVKYQYFIQPTEEDPKNCFFFSWHLLKDSFGSTVFEGVPLKYVSFFQSKMKVLGIRVGNLAYISDIKNYEEEIFLHLHGVEILIVSALKEDGSIMHFSIQEALDFAKVIQPKKVYLTHIAHQMDHEKIQACLPSDVFLAYDGLSISFFMDGFNG